MEVLGLNSVPEWRRDGVGSMERQGCTQAEELEILRKHWGRLLKPEGSNERKRPEQSTTIFRAQRLFAEPQCILQNRGQTGRRRICESTGTVKLLMCTCTSGFSANRKHHSFTAKVRKPWLGTVAHNCNPSWKG